MQDKEKPLVSIVMPAFNGGKFLEEAILSVWAQTYPNYELIVVHDGSDDPEIKNICRRYEERLTYIFQENKGTASARNTAIKNSCGEYIAFLDEDDVWLPEKLEKQVAFYEDLKKKNVFPGLIYTGLYVIDEKGSVLHKGLHFSSGRNFEKLFFCDFIGAPCSVMTTRAALDDVGFFDETIRGREDYDLWMRIAKKYLVYSMDQYLAKYRFRKGTFSKDPDIMVEGLKKIFAKMQLSEIGAGLQLSQKIERRITREAARRFKDSAYRKLFDEMDAKTFRDYIQKGRSCDPSIFGLPTLFYYLLSYFSPAFCRFLRKFKRRPLKDVYVDVNYFSLEDWIKRNGG